MAMATSKAEGGEDVVSDINITPLCDILVVLLIIFMVTAQATVLQGPKVSAPADNPHTAPVNQPQRESVTVTMDDTGRISCNGRMTALADLEARLREELPRTTKEQVMIRAHHALPLDTVMQVMEAAERAGAKGIGIGTQLR